MTILDMHAEDKVRAQADPSHHCQNSRCITCFANIAVYALNAKNEVVNESIATLNTMSRERSELAREVAELRKYIGSLA